MSRVDAVCVLCGCSRAVKVWASNLPEDVKPAEFGYCGKKEFNGQVVRCEDCGHMYVNPLTFCPEDMYVAVSDPFYLETESYRNKTFSDFLDVKERNMPRKGKLLDVGCYIGTFMGVARERGYDVEGIELSSWALNVARSRGYKVHQSSLINFRGEREAYSNISAFDVLEHLSDPLENVRKVYSLLKPGGCFFVTVPDRDAWHAKLLGSRHWLVILMHLQYFSRKSLRNLMVRAGFSSIRIIQAPPYRLCLRDAGYYFKTNKLLHVLHVLFSRVPLINRVEIRLKASLVCVAVK